MLIIIVIIVIILLFCDTHYTSYRIHLSIELTILSLQEKHKMEHTCDQAKGFGEVISDVF